MFTYAFIHWAASGLSCGPPLHQAGSSAAARMPTAPQTDAHCASQVQELLHVGLLVAPRHGDPRSLTRDRTHVPCIARWILNHGTTREVPQARFLCVGSQNSLHGVQPLYMPLNIGKLLLSLCLPSSASELLLIFGDSNQLPPTLESLS